MRTSSLVDRLSAPSLVAMTSAFALATVNVAPVVTAFGSGRRTVFPNLAGIGAASGVALTFDDGPDPASTPRFLAELDRLGWCATFFVLGAMVRRNPSLVRDLVDAGHEVALHGDSHRAHIWRTPRDVVHDLRQAYDTISEAAGVEPRWFRPPHGYLSAGSLLGARALGVQTVLWTAWGRDWTADATPASVASTIARDLRPGGTMLLHDADCTSVPGAWRSALGALPLLAEQLDRQNLRVVALRDHWPA
jgi:peptidoglycan/xylan/chitin deacetylase (PgdA/CDA1 family)